MKWVDLKVGDDVWYFVGNHNGKKTKGTVVMIVEVPGFSYKHYIIEYPTHIEPILEIRDGFSVSDAADKPIGLWRKNC